MKKQTIPIILAIIAIGALGIFVARKHTKPEGRYSTRLGTILGLTGDNASYGQKMQRGFEIALNEVNSAGGVNGTNLALLIEDSQFDPAKAVSAYRKLTGAQDVHVIVGITGSKNAIPVCEASKGDNVI